MEEALASSEATLRTLLDINPDEAFLVASDGHVLVANPAAAYGFDRPLEEIIGRQLDDLLTHDEAELVLAHKEVAVRTGRSIRFEASAGGRVRDYRICPIGDGSGGVTSLALFRQDVSDRAAAEVALREANRAPAGAHRRGPVRDRRPVARGAGESLEPDRRKVVRLERGRGGRDIASPPCRTRRNAPSARSSTGSCGGSRSRRPRWSTAGAAGSRSS